MKGSTCREESFMRRRQVLSCGLFAASMLLGVAATVPGSAAQNEPFGRFTVDELDAKIKEAKAGRGKLYVYDNNTRERFKHSHVPTARWVDYSRLLPSDLPKERDATLVFYCANEH
jgi:hypothetical protein